MSIPRATLRTHRIIRTVASLVIIASIFAAWRFVNFSVLFDTVNANGYDPSVELQDIIANIRLTPAGDRIMRGTRAELQDADAFNASCERSEEKIILLGCYANNQIFVYNIDDRDLKGVREATLAHELLHAVWARTPASERDALKVSLKSLYDKNEDLQKHLKLYNESEFYDELHSIVGSQIDNDLLPADLKVHYAKYFQDQNLIAKFYHKYNDNLTATEKRLDELEKIMESSGAALQTRLDAYNMANQKLSDDVAAFNSKASKGTMTEEEYNIGYADLTKRKEEMLAEYNAIQAAIEDYNVYVTEYNKYVVFTKKIYNSMDSKAKKPEAN